jgi:hypothetical protein
MKNGNILGGAEIFGVFGKNAFFTTYVKIPTHLKHFQAFLRRIKEYAKISKKCVKN